MKKLIERIREKEALFEQAKRYMRDYVDERRYDNYIVKYSNKEYVISAMVMDEKIEITIPLNKILMLAKEAANEDDLKIKIDSYILDKLYDEYICKESGREE